MIVFDAVTTNNPSATNTSTYAHTVAKLENRVLIVGVSAFDTTIGNRTVSTITYGGVGLTRIGTDADNATSNGRTALFYLLNPATGANNTVITMGGTCNNFANYSTSFSGVKQVYPPQTASQTTVTASKPATINLTGLIDGELIVDVMNGNAGPMSFNSSQSTLMNQNSSTGMGGYRILGAAGTYAASYTTSANDDYALSAAMFAPVFTGLVNKLRPAIFKPGISR